MMCPACIANAATFAFGITSSGGVVALVFAKIRRMAGFHKLSPDSKGSIPKLKEKQS
ncbi:MAG TPA: hypothetical protein VFI38_06315 [Candidatus Acidoferrum sp.]|nr:hypothetical protein [Candidatus Acidoferrum sp.]